MSQWSNRYTSQCTHKSGFIWIVKINLILLLFCQTVIDKFNLNVGYRFLLPDNDIIVVDLGCTEITWFSMYVLHVIWKKEVITISELYKQLYFR